MRIRARSQRGFTLVELLVLLAILAVAAALLAAALLRVREGANRIRCNRGPAAAAGAARQAVGQSGRRL